MAEREFPIHPCDAGPKRRSVPWAFLAPHEARAIKNHDQTLERLAERGGLSFCEIVAVVEGREWHSMNGPEVERRIEELLTAWGATR